MRTSLIVFAILVITGLSGVTGSAQEKGKARGNRQIVGGAGGAGSLAVTRKNRQISINTGSGNDTFRSAGIKDGTSNTLMNARSRTGRTETVDKNETITVHGRSARANSLTFEGNDEPLWANKTSSQQLVQGNYIGTNVRPRRTGLFGDSNGDSDVDAADYALRSSSQKNNISSPRRSGITGGDLNTDGPDTVGRSSSNKVSSPQTLSAGTYGRGRQNSLLGLLIP